MAGQKWHGHLKCNNKPHFVHLMKTELISGGENCCQRGCCSYGWSDVRNKGMTNECIFFWGLIWFPCSEFRYCLLRTPDHEEESTCCMWVAVSDRQGEQGIEGGVVLPQQVILLLRQQTKKWCTFSEKAILFTAGGLNDQQNRSTIYPCYSSWWLLQECHFKKLRKAKCIFLLSKG